MKKNLIISGLIIFMPVLIIGIYYFIQYQKENSIKFNPQKTQVYKIKEEENNPLDILATTLPQFALNIANKKYKNLWTAEAFEKTPVESRALDSKGNFAFTVKYIYDNEKKEIMFTPNMSGNFKPGMYSLDIRLKTYTGKEITITQDFTWGVVAINTNKGIYQTGEKVKFAMTVLDNDGRTKCIAKKEDPLVGGTARVNLKILSPSGKIQELSSDEGSIVGSKECQDRKVTNLGDFLAEITANEVGKYKVYMEAEIVSGKRLMEYYFKVQNEPPLFDIERTAYPTRIFPSAFYPVEITIKANKDYSGIVYDIIPSELKISEISGKGKLNGYKEFQTIDWNVDWKKGETYVLSYTIKFPRVVPEFYLIGPLTIGDFNEGRAWQVASDTIFQFIQEAHNTATTGTSLTATFSTGATLNHLLVLICARDQNSTINTPTGWTRAWRYTSNAPRMSVFYRLATSGQTTGSCSFSSNGGIGAQMLEFSGNGPSTTGLYDSKSGNYGRTASCGTTNSTPTITATNPDELVVSSWVATNGNITFSGHHAITGVDSVGFTDTESSEGGYDGYYNANASYDSGWGEAINNPATGQYDSITLSSSGGSCTRGISYFNPQISVSQGSYRFFENANDITPGSPLGAVNTILQLNAPNYQFRLRALLDIDSPSGTSIGLQTADFILQYGTMSAAMSTCADITQWDNVSTPENGTDIAYYTNPDSGGSGSNISSSGNDPSDGGYTTRLQSYYQDDINGPNGPNPGNITNDQLSLSNNEAGLWDLSLLDNTDGSVSSHYCLRIANPDGSELSAYRNYPQVITVQTDVNIRGGSTIRGGTTIR